MVSNMSRGCCLSGFSAKQVAESSLRQHLTDDHASEGFERSSRFTPNTFSMIKAVISSIDCCVSKDSSSKCPKLILSSAESESDDVGVGIGSDVEEDCRDVFNFLARVTLSEVFLGSLQISVTRRMYTWTLTGFQFGY